MSEEGITAGIDKVKNVILVMSGKGGVGKSSVTTQLAVSLMKAGKKVGLLDIDLCGPSVPTIFNLGGSNIHTCDAGWVPIYKDKDQLLSLMSIGFLLSNQDDAVVWRGPKKSAMVKQFITDVCWGELDFLLIDTPPGTSDEHMSIVESLRPFNIKGVVLVTTPQAVALMDVRKEINFCKRAKLKVLGMLENMSGYICPHCDECTNVLSSGGGEELSKQFSIPFLGRLPLDPALGKAMEGVEDIIDELQSCKSYKTLASIIGDGSILID